MDLFLPCYCKDCIAILDNIAMPSSRTLKIRPRLAGNVSVALAIGNKLGIS